MKANNRKTFWITFISIICLAIIILGAVWLNNKIQWEKSVKTNLIIIVYNANSVYENERFTGFIDSKRVFSKKISRHDQDENTNLGQWLYFRINSGEHNITIYSKHGEPVSADIIIEENPVHILINYTGGETPEMEILPNYKPRAMF